MKAQTVQRKATSIDIEVKDGDEVYQITLNPSSVAGDMSIIRLQRREKFLAAKIEKMMETASSADDFDSIEKDERELDEIQSKAIDMMRSMFTSNNEKGKAYIKGLSLFELIALNEDIKSQVEGVSQGEESNGGAETATDKTL